MSNSRPPEFPRVYDICPTCGYDHDFDLPRLPADVRLQASLLHLRRDGSVTGTVKSTPPVTGGNREPA